MALVRSIFDTEDHQGTYSSERERYERVFLERRADNRQGHKPRPLPATPEPVERVAPAPAPTPAPRTQPPLERRMSLQEMARRIGAKSRRA
jgi:hypothetical protein